MQQPLAIRHQRAIVGTGAIPFQHGEFGVVGGAALAIAEGMGELEDFRHSRRQQLLHGKFGRGVEEERPHAVGFLEAGGEGTQMRLKP